VKSLVSFLLVSALLTFPQTTRAQSSAPPQCTQWRACRDLAEQARAAGDYEAFHDLAWRAVQTRGRRDPSLFFLLARAQSLSGRPHDAMITLQRLAQEMHAPKDVSQDEDFRRVRALPGWPEVRAIIAEATSGQTPEASAQLARQSAEREGEGPAATAQPEVGGRGSAASIADSRTAPEKRSAEPASRSNRKNRPEEPSAGTSEEVARFAAGSFDAGGLAYDAVSRRFVIGNLPARKLTIVEEGTNRAATLSGNAAQLLNVRALEIDRTQGDLWVVSEGSREGPGSATSELHKLQLVSGRVLAIYTPGPSSGSSRFVDVAIGRGSEVLVLDAAGPRLLRPAKSGRKLVTVMDLPAGEVASLAPADDGRTVYVAYADHVVRVDLGTHHVGRVIGRHADLSGLMRFRWHDGSLVGAQAAGGTQRIVQLRLMRNGARVASSRTLDGSDVPSTSLTAVDVLEDDFFYLVPGQPQATIRRIRLK